MKYYRVNYPSHIHYITIRNANQNNTQDCISNIDIRNHLPKIVVRSTIERGIQTP